MQHSDVFHEDKRLHHFKEPFQMQGAGGETVQPAEREIFKPKDYL
jgi:hypothetical protein